MLHQLLQPVIDAIAYVINGVRHRPEASALWAGLGIAWDRLAPQLGAAFPAEPRVVVAIGGLMAIDFALGLMCARAEGRPVNSHTSRAMSTPKLIGYSWLYAIGVLSCGATGDTWIYNAILGWITGKEVWSGWEKLHRMGLVSTSPEDVLDQVGVLSPIRSAFGGKGASTGQHDALGKGEDPNV